MIETTWLLVLLYNLKERICKNRSVLYVLHDLYIFCIVFDVCFRSGIGKKPDVARLKLVKAPSSLSYCPVPMLKLRMRVLIDVFLALW